MLPFQISHIFVYFSMSIREIISFLNITFTLEELKTVKAW